MIVRGNYRLFRAESKFDINRAQEFRGACFELSGGRDADELDEIYTHVLIEDDISKELICCFRVFPLTADELHCSYASQFYDLTALFGFHGPMLEVGRFCVSPNRNDPDILRLAWAGLTDYVDRNRIKLLFGCTSFRECDPSKYIDVFSMLQESYLAPDHFAPRVKAPETYRFDNCRADSSFDRKAIKNMPALLRSYLKMGAWVSDHAVIDRAFNTLHVFTGVEIDAIPKERQRLLRAI